VAGVLVTRSDAGRVAVVVEFVVWLAGFFAIEDREPMVVMMMMKRSRSGNR
jgi:hypothetical protein